MFFAPLASARVFQSEEHAFVVDKVTEKLRQPWGMAFLPDGAVLITEKQGRLRLLAQGKLHPKPITGLPRMKIKGQGGLMGLAIHPQFKENRWVYLAYANQGVSGWGTDVIRGKLHNHALTEIEEIFASAPKVGGGRHFGARLVFGKDGALFISLGDRGQRGAAQELGNHIGALIRLNADGSVPADNPFVTKPGAKPEIYTYGNRNMQGMAMHPMTHVIWTHEHGPQGGDEVNVMRAGANYGWPVITYGVNYGIGTKIGEGTARAGMEQPVHKWTPSIAPSGMTFYTGRPFPKWQGDVFVGSLKFGQLVRLRLNGERVTHEERLFNGEFGRIRDVKQGPDGYLYFLTDERAGKLYRIAPS